MTILETSALVALFLLNVGMAIFLAGLAYLVADINRRLGPDLGAVMPNEAIGVGELVPALSASEARSGKPVDLASHAGRQVLLAFLSPTCAPCVNLIPHLNRFARERASVPVIVVASASDRGADYSRELSKRIALVIDQERTIEQAYKASRTPLVYLIDEERRVANRTVSNSLVDLEDTLDGLGRPVGDASWVVKN